MILARVGDLGEGKIGPQIVVRSVEMDTSSGPTGHVPPQTSSPSA